jgi:SAM-dependent methyltransferase
MTMHDELSQINRERWNALVEARVMYSQPMLDLTAERARSIVDNAGFLGDVTGKRVLVLAGGGGQQSIAFALLGAHVTVYDLSDAQLAQDRLAAEQLRLTLEIVHGDMRDLSAFADRSFDLVYQPYSINFVPDVRPVIKEVARVIRPGSLYRIDWHNPFTQTLDEEQFTGEGWILKHEYVDGRFLGDLFPHWTVEDENGICQPIPAPRAYVHTLSTMVNTLAGNGFVILNLAEWFSERLDRKPGGWYHFTHVAPPYLQVWTRYRPDAFLYSDQRRPDG